MEFELITDITGEELLEFLNEKSYAMTSYNCPEEYKNYQKDHPINKYNTYKVKYEQYWDGYSVDKTLVEIF